MSTELIKSVVAEQENEMIEKFKRENIIERENQSAVTDYLKPNIALIITGLRRTGKSVFSFSILKGKKYGYVNFEDERLSDLNANEMNKVLEAIYSLKGNVETFLFDEIQNIYGWEKFISRLVPNHRVIITTGSNATLMSRELATYLTGRHLDFTLFPFSFREYLHFKNFISERQDIYITSSIAKIKEHLNEYIKIGGIPEGISVGKKFILQLENDIIEKDIIQRYKIRHVKKLKELSHYLLSNFSSEISYNKMKNILNVRSVTTVSNWVDYLESSYLIFELNKYSPKLKEQMLSPKKVYCIDNSIINSLSFKTSENWGRLMENLVSVELLRRKSYWHNEWEIFYFKDYQQNEVDFLIREGYTVKELMQVSYASGFDEIEKREYRSLIKASDLFRCNELKIITWDYEDVKSIDGKRVNFIPLWKWLIMPA